MGRKEAVTILQEKRDLTRKLEAAEKSADWAAKDRVDSSSLRASQHGRYADALDMAISALSPPNDPLTLEELRKMDGEPAWWDDGEGSCWGIISVDSAGMWGGIPFLRGRWRQVNFEYNIEERKMRIYRRPPEGEVDT